MDEKPKLRPLEAIPFQSGGEQLVCLRDPEGISRQTAVLPPRAFFVAAMCDGNHTLPEIQAEYVNRFGDLLLQSKIEEMLRQLDDALLLEGPRFEAHRKEMAAEFARAPRRRAAGAGNAYPAEPRALKRMLAGFFTAPDGPGEMDPARRGKNVVAGVLPHIDFARGGAAYAHGWKALAEGCAAETFVILGVAHNAAKSAFVMTDKEFETPLGTVPCDREFAHDLARRAGLRRDEGEFLHRSEHSVEFQAVWLKHVFGAARPARIVPVLCGSILETVGEREDPLQSEPLAQFVGALREILREQGDRAAVIASVDLSHVGARFGDAVTYGPEMLASVESDDRALLRHAEACDARGFFDCNRLDGDRRHVCGFGALYTLLASITAARGRLLRYAQAPQPDTQSMVSFAAMAFEK